MNSASGLIQIMLAPGIMISACGLLLLGMNNKYSLVVNRIRLLKDEQRKANYNNEVLSKQHSSLNLQISKLFFRISLIRNAVFSYSVAVAFFIISSVLIGLNKISEPADLHALVMIFFLAGMAFVLSGILFAAIEVWKGFQIIKIEVEDES